VIREVRYTERTSEQNDGGYPVQALASLVDANATAQAAEAAASPTAIVTPRAARRTKKEIAAAVRIQTACRGYLVMHLRS
jgi:hypothetical protein